MNALYFLFVWLHVAAAAVWIGGMVFLAAVLVPALRKGPFAGVSAALLYRTGLRFRRVGWTGFGVLVFTGILNLGMRGFTWGDAWNGVLWNGPWGRALGGKLTLVAFVLALSAVHDFYVGPRAVAVMEEAPGSAEMIRLRKAAGWMGRMTLVLSLLILALAVTLPRGGL